jgi:hypothetical protein
MKAQVCMILGKHQEGEEANCQWLKVIEEDNILSQAKCLNARAYNRYQMGDFKGAQEDFESTEKLLEGTKALVHVMYYNFRAQMVLEQGKSEEAYNFVLKSQEFNKDVSISPLNALSNYYLLSILDKSYLSLPQKVALAAHPAHSDFSYLYGRKWYPDKCRPMLAIYQDKYKDTDKDCWLVEKNSITALNYFDDSPYTQIDDTLDTLDLYAGVKHSPSKGVVATLTEQQATTLYALIGAGDLGVSKWILADFVYRYSFHDPASGEKNLAKIITALRRDGHSIELKSNYYFYSIKKKDRLLLPMHHFLQHRSNYLKRQAKKFYINNLEHVYNIKSSTAKRWANEWVSNGIVDKNDTKDGLCYSFL